MSHIDRCVLFYYSLLDYYYWLFMWKQHFIMWMIQFIYFICLIYSNKSHFMSILFQNVTSNFNCKINVESVYISLWSVAQYQVCRWDSTSCQHLPTICFCYDHFMSFKMSVWINMSSGFTHCDLRLDINTICSVTGWFHGSCVGLLFPTERSYLWL